MSGGPGIALSWPRGPVLMRCARRVLLLVLLSPFLYLGLRAAVELDAPAYAEVFNLEVWPLLWRTVRLALGATVVAALLGGGAAVVFEARSFPVPRVLRALAFTPLLVPPVFQVAVWERLAAPGGVLATLFSFLATPDGRFPLRNLTCAMCVLGVSYSPLLFFFASHGLRSIPAGLVDAARLYRGPAATRLRVQLPLALPAILVGLAVTFTFTALNYEVPRLLDVNTYPVLVNLRFEAEDSPGVAFVYALPLFLVAAGFLLASHSWADRRGFSLAECHGASVDGARPRPGAVAWGVLSAWLGIAVVLPAAVLVSLAGSATVFAEAFATDWEKIFWSAGVAAATALAAATLAACALTPEEPRGHPWRTLLWLPLALPGSLLASGLIHLRGEVPAWMLPLYDGPWVLVIAGALRFFPLAYFALVAHLRTVPATLWLAARAGPRPSQRALEVYLPLAWRGLVVGAVAVALFQSQELSATVLLAPPGYEPLILRIYNLLHYDPERSVLAALCLYQVVAVVLVIGALLFWDRRGGNG